MKKYAILSQRDVDSLRIDLVMSILEPNVVAAIHRPINSYISVVGVVDGKITQIYSDDNYNRVTDLNPEHENWLLR